MHSVRRAALRATCSSARIVALPRQQVASFAMNVSKANVRPAMSMPLARPFSHTVRVAQEAREPSAEEASESSDAQPEVADAQPEVSNDSPLQSSPTLTEEGRAGPSIFVSNIVFDATDLHLREAFSKYGDITQITIGRDGRGLSRGFAFIAFKDQEACDRAVSEANKSFWHGRRINVEHRQAAENREPRGRAGRSPNTPTDSLYIGNIPYETSDADLNRMFRELENVRDVRVAVDRNTGWPRGFAHADFMDVESAVKAHEKLSEISLGGRKLRVDYSERRQGFRTESRS
ncbi:RNA-binding domain-containing protein [Xylariomycetidae sp. FL2044]|nr:RNA-binding domain-containing protein [Xylariomycetidae sp. FL2044]